MTVLFLLRRLCQWTLLLVLLGSLCRADAFDDAAPLYEKGQAAEAATAYEDLLQTRGPSFALLYNLGNAHYRAGAIGKALWAWREAEYLNPWDSDLQANISTALVHANLPQPKGFIEASLRRVRLPTAAWTTLTLSVASAVLFGFALWNPGLFHRTTALRWLIGIAAACAWIIYLWALWAKATGPNAIVIARDVSVRHGPLEEAPAAYAVPDGSELRIIGVRKDWYHVEDSARKAGWIAQVQVKRLLP